MKTCLAILLVACYAATVGAQDSQPLQPSAKTQLFSLDYQTALAPKAEAPNEMKWGRATVTGVFPQAIKTKQPWQLVNPAAPPQYWAPDGNADRDNTTHQVTGFKFLSFKF